MDPMSRAANRYILMLTDNYSWNFNKLETFKKFKEFNKAETENFHGKKIV